MDGWYYRSFELDMGPVSHQELVELIKAHSITGEDEVRFGAHGGWRRVGSIGTLMAHLPFDDAWISKMKRGPKGTVEGSTAAIELPTRPMQNPKASVAVTAPTANQWWCRIQDDVFGPIDLDKVIDLAKSHVISRDDEVRFGETGVWRRVGSIGQLMAHLPYESKEKVISNGARKGPSDAQISTIDESDSDANGYEIASNAAAPEVEDRWWCRIENREYGPVELPKIVEWAATGRLLKTDEVRFGSDPYMVAGELAGLFPEEINPAAVVTAASKPVNPEKKPPETKAISQDPPKTEQAPSDNSPKPDQPSSSPAPSGFGGGFSSPGAATKRPAVPFRPPMKMKGKSGGGGVAAKLIPVGIGVGGILVLGALIYFGIMMIPESTGPDIARLKTLKAAFEQVDKARRSDGKGQEKYAPVKEALEKAAKSVTAELKPIANKKPYQSKLAYVARKMQELAKGDIGDKPGDAESAISNAISGLESTFKL